MREGHVELRKFPKKLCEVVLLPVIISSGVAEMSAPGRGFDKVGLRGTSEPPPMPGACAGARGGLRGPLYGRLRIFGLFLRILGRSGGVLLSVRPEPGSGRGRHRTAHSQVAVARTL